MDDYYSKQKRGGVVNSKIEHQDSVAIIYSLEILDSCTDISQFCENIKDYCIICEGNDDIEIFDTDKHIFIQVKSVVINRESFLNIMANCLNNMAKEKSKKSYFILSCFDNIKLKNDSFIEKLNEYHQLYKIKDTYGIIKVLDAKKELMHIYEIPDKYSDILDRLYIDTRPLLKDGNDTMAIFSRCLRLAYDIVDIGDKKTSRIYNLLERRFSYARRNRGSITEKEIKKIIDEELCKSSIFNNIDLMVGYEKSKYGYVKSNALNEKQINIAYGARKAMKSVMKSWRKAYMKEFFMSMLIGAKCCPVCKRPMMANIQGLNGIACPDCSFNPYVTIFGFCECGNYYVIKTQPELKGENFFEYIHDYWNNRENTKCEKCSKELVDEFIDARIFLAPVPYPFDEYKNIDNIYGEE